MSMSSKQASRIITKAARAARKTPALAIEFAEAGLRYPAGEGAGPSEFTLKVERALRSLRPTVSGGTDI